jgi:two-component system, cell cycle sensor histidine kinase and response regulator CckA
MYEHSSDPIVVIDDDGRMVSANRAARELAGVDIERLFLWTPHRDPDLASLRAQLRVGGRGVAELRLPDGEGDARVLALEGRAHGTSYVIVLRDITERRRLEEELRHLRQLEDVGHLAASVVHDFNNVLTAIVCATSVLVGDVAGQERPSALARDIRGAAERAAGLIRQMLSLVRRQPAAPARLSLSDAVEETRPLMELVLGPGIELSLLLDPKLGDTLVEREQLDHVLLNLAANARDAMPRGGKVTLATANVPFGDETATAASCANALSYVSLTVTDSGEGMPPEVRDHVFERFYTTKPAGKGAGLGLATAYRFVKRSGGCIAVRSAPGQGTTIVMYLPRVPSLAETLVVPRAERDVPSGTETLLLIDSDDPVRGAVRAVLRELGYNVLDAPTGDLALSQAETAEGPIALVLADLRAPGMPGPEVVARLGASGRSPKLLWMSGDTDRAIAEQGLADEPVLRKAFSPSQLARRVRDVLDASPTPSAPSRG